MTISFKTLVNHDSLAILQNCRPTQKENEKTQQFVFKIIYLCKLVDNAVQHTSVVLRTFFIHSNLNLDITMKASVL